MKLPSDLGEISLPFWIMLSLSFHIDSSGIDSDLKSANDPDLRRCIAPITGLAVL